MKKLNLHIFRGRPKKHVPIFPTAYCCDYLASGQSVTEYGDRVTSLVYCFTDEDVIATINSKEDYERMGNSLIDKNFSVPGYLDDLINWSEENRNLLVDFIEENLGEGIIRTLNNQEIADRYSEYCELYRSYHLKNTPSWWVGSDALLARVTKYLQDHNVEGIDMVISQLIDATEYKTEAFEEELSLLGIAQELQLAGVAKADYEGLNNFPNVKARFDRHVRDFSSIPFGYNTGILWDKEYFLRKIDNVLSEGNIQELIDSRLAEVRDKENKQKVLSDTLALPNEIISYLKNLRQLAYLQELKKATQVRSHPTLQLIVKKEIAKRLSASVDVLDGMSHMEVKYCLAQDKISAELLNHIEQRLKRCVIIMKELNYEWLIGDEAKEFFKLHGFADDLTDDIKELKGATASKGFARGIVKVCKLSTEISKITEGDILVTAMTTPDFVPAMKKTAGIITDEGGITCHAAIVSRELGKPCIIGTKIATKVLKDGDIVEVDADNGVVRILSRAADHKA